MGGCRCSYKNCTVRTDGVTHMFHYPVFDKVRCHQWLTNAQKLEFLNLKVSQLKNRVVCQHHFKDDNFMNFLKDKLTFEAVPTENGPHCDSSQLSDKKPEQDDTKLYSISLEDIENEYLTFNDKKANFSVKYGDFLTNCDLMDLDSLNLTNDNTHLLSKDKDYEEHVILNDNIDRRNPVTLNSETIQPKSENVYTIYMTEVPVEVDNKEQSNTKRSYTSADPTIPKTTEQDDSIKRLTNTAKDVPKNKTGRSLLKEKKVTILNEQKVSETFPFPEKLEVVCPSTILPLPKRRKNLNMQLANDKNDMHNNSAKLVAPDSVEGSNIEEFINIMPHVAPSIGKEVNNVKVLNSSVVLDNVNKNDPLNSEDVIKNVNTRRHDSPPNTRGNILNTVTTKKSNNNMLLKTRVPPERLAAIEKKRKFNMKLRDIIASCLDKLDDEENKDSNKSKLQSKIEKKITQKVSSYMSKDPDLPSVHDYSVAYLEARMKKMESILINKIDQNSRRIMELKQSFSPASKSKSVYTQTAESEEQTKKFHYQELSKYLSPETNSLIYEELFINKYVPKITQCSSKKKRKCR